MASKLTLQSELQRSCEERCHQLERLREALAIEFCQLAAALDEKNYRAAKQIVCAFELAHAPEQVAAWKQAAWKRRADMRGIRVVRGLSNAMVKANDDG